MKVRLLHPEDDLDLKAELPWRLSVLTEEDLELNRLYEAMAEGDTYLLETVKTIVPLSVVEPDTIIYRQRVLTDCLANPAAVQQLYGIATAVEGIELRHKVFLGGLSSGNPALILRRSVRILELLTDTLRQLRRLSDRHVAAFRSTGFRQLFAMFADQLSDDYLAGFGEYLRELNLPHGVLLSAELGLGNRGDRHVLHHAPRRSKWAKPFGNPNDGYGFQIDRDDMAGEQALDKLAGHAVNDVASAVTRAAEHFQVFFARLRTELAFYLGCVNLYDALAKREVPTCFPEPAAIDTPRFRVRGLRDVALCLTTSKKVAGNDVDADDKTLIVITGANEGGKSTFVRSAGAAQLMMQAGMFVAADSFTANVRDGIFTHFKREEDVTLRRGKLEEELARMSDMVEHIGPTSMLLCNESFASTNELEGSQIARGIVHAMVESGVKVFFVTHLYDLAHSLFARHDPADLFLRAERRDDGVRTFRLTPGEPQPTSHGEDNFRRIFGVPASEHYARSAPD